jgi:hypothetical protein
MHIINELKDTYKQMDLENIGQIKKIYAEDIIFIDPFHQIEGLDALRRYFENMYQNLISINFNYGDEMISDDNAMLTWQMDYAHRSIKGGDVISLPGATHLKFNEKIYYHHDYFDASAMLFEHIPIVGSAIKWIKKRV